jgi:hypothetical protein
VTVISLMAIAYFAALILLWTFGLTAAPIDNVIRLSVWLIPLALSLSWLRYLWLIDRKEASK